MFPSRFAYIHNCAKKLTYFRFSFIDAYYRRQLGCISGADKRLGHRLGRRRGLLPRLQRHRLGSQCGKRPSLHTITGSNHLAKYSGYQKSA